MGKQARLKTARKIQRSATPGAWALDSKNKFSARNTRRIYALTRPPLERGNIGEITIESANR